MVGLPGVVGIIDGTQAQITAPFEDEHTFLNRKKFHSVSSQVVFDVNYNNLDIVAKWPGVTHDSCILRESGWRLLFERHHVPAGGHSGYTCRMWLLTPFIHPQCSFCSLNFWELTLWSHEIEKKQPNGLLSICGILFGAWLQRSRPLTEAVESVCIFHTLVHTFSKWEGCIYSHACVSPCFYFAFAVTHVRIFLW